MKRTFLTLLPLAALAAAAACNLLDNEADNKSHDNASADSGYISLVFDESHLYISSDDRTKASTGKTPLDTNAFLLQVTDQSGKSIYSGKYGDSPENILVGAGTYNIKAVSEEFSKPAFDAPQWGDEQYVKVESGSNAIVKLVCCQMNSGVKLNISSSFLTEYPDAALLLKNTDGSLMYSYSEKRTAYFNPGRVELVMSRGGVDEVLLERTLSAREILSLTINTTSTQTEQSRVSIAVDTSRNYTSDVLTLGESGADSVKGQDASNAYTISQARDAVGDQDVWVGAYIVGGDLTSKGISFEAPFSSASNLAIGARSNTSTREKCMSVQLPSGKIRDALNLVSHPELLGRFVYLHGDIDASYFGLTGLKNVDDYSLK